MSLRVWIPFTDGTEKNQGTSNLTFANSNSSKTYSLNTGKLGKCFYNNAYYNSAGLISNEIITLPVTLSWFCWAKFDSFGSQSSLNGVVTNHDYANKKNMGITVLYLSSTTGKLSCNTGNGSGRTYNTYTGNTILNAGTWYHIGFTYDGSNIRFYVNGELDGTTAYTGLSLGAAKIGIFRWDTMTANNYNMHGSLNDVRIYDHCLTPQEVKEISKGLVCHYTLGSASLASSGNLINGLEGGGLCTVSGNSINVSGTNSDTYFIIKTTKAMTSGKLYRLSCIGSGFPEVAIYNFPIAGQSNTDPGQIRIKNGPCMLTFVANDACANAGTNIIMDDTGRIAGAGTISGLCLEEINSVSDSSGYSRNLTITGNVSPADSIRYDKGIYMPNQNLNNNYLTSGSNWSPSFITIGSISFWCKFNGLGSNGWLPFTGQDGNYFLMATLHGTGGFYHNNSGSPTAIYRDGITASAPSDNENWHHYVITGINLSTWTTFKVNQYGTTWNSNIYISDLRLYNTILSADDVKDLYSLGATIS